ncbi:hypothetical protein F4814DRAFT_457971 [Daldinia grandis]|nr:hypothetical protein F4814DRAFT_457971 [Daldinia grandis]
MPPPSEQELYTPNPSEGTSFVGIMLDGMKKATKYFFGSYNIYATEQPVCFFVQWIYARSLGPYNLNEGLRELCRREQYETLLNSWLFGQEVEATEFQKDIMRCIAEEPGRVELAISVAIWIETEALSSRSRPFLADIWCAKLRSSDADCVNAFLKDVPRSMLEEVSQRMITGSCGPQKDMDLTKYLK